MEPTIEHTDIATVITRPPEAPELTIPLPPAKIDTPVRMASAHTKMGLNTPKQPRKTVTKHIHDFTGLGGHAVIGTNKAILVRTCTCGTEQAFEMGNKEKMRELYLRIEMQREVSNV